MCFQTFRTWLDTLLVLWVRPASWLTSLAVINSSLIHSLCVKCCVLYRMFNSQGCCVKKCNSKKKAMSIFQYTCLFSLRWALWRSIKRADVQKTGVLGPPQRGPSYMCASLYCTSQSVTPPSAVYTVASTVLPNVLSSRHTRLSSLNHHVLNKLYPAHSTTFFPEFIRD